MRTAPWLHSALVGALLSAPALAPWAQGQAFASSTMPAGLGGGSYGSSSADSSLYADGTRAINQGRWADAIAVFGKVAGLQGDHADGALYWKAYAENKQGQTRPALDTCNELRHHYQGSSWIHECGALEIEILAKSGKPAVRQTGQDEDLKLLALNALLKTHESQALAQIQEILNGDSNEKLKKEAQFILGNHYSDLTWPQIVRVSYVEGDVRIARGTQNEKETGAAWEKAEADLPLETGFSLVTGDGRAEIELEDASTLYLGPNSVLSMNDLHTSSGIPYTDMALLAGTVSLYVHPMVAGELFLLRTPADNLLSRYPNKSYARVGSFLDAMTVTPLEGGTLHLPGIAKDAIVPGQTLAYRDGHIVPLPQAAEGQGFSAWDKWVAERVDQRARAMTAVMAEAGLTTPLPGLADLQGRGTFFDCAPYGTCWEPKDIGAAQSAGKEAVGGQTSSAQAALRSTGTNSLAAGDLSQELDFPCVPAGLRYSVVRDPNTGQQRVISSNLAAQVPGDDWGVCHAGSWIHRGRHYVWVAGQKRHHVEPVRWIKSGHDVAFVPIHPYDVKGRPPINRKEEAFEPGGMNGTAIKPVHFDQGGPITFLPVAPKAYRNPPQHPLARAEAPHMEAHRLSDSSANKINLARAGGGIPLSFDRRSQAFTIPQEAMHGGRSVTVQAPISNHGGNLQSRGGNFGAGFGGSSGAHGSAGSSGGVHSGGASGDSGGGTHSGGGSSSAGAASSSASSSAVSSSGAGSAAGGSTHH